MTSSRACGGEQGRSAGCSLRRSRRGGWHQGRRAPGRDEDPPDPRIEAEKEAAANVILRREETAATRSLANTARVMAEHPVFLRLKELEAMKEIAERIKEVRVVIGADGFGALLPAGLLAHGEKVGSG